MYMIHHSAGNPKGIVYGWYTVFIPPGETCLGVLQDVLYSALELGGSSGSPVFCQNTHLVEALNHCRDGGYPDTVCSPGWGVPMSLIAPQVGPELLGHGCTYDFQARSNIKRIPTLTEFGILVLIILILTSGIWVFIRRRKIASSNI
jgi:hypothetical protein